jgi:hypothetical protein
MRLSSLLFELSGGIKRLVWLYIDAIIADNGSPTQESGPPQTLATPGKTATGAIGGRPEERHDDHVNKGCCGGGCVIL